jgi:DNA-binding NarL/FixJ family response regulator
MIENFEQMIDGQPMRFCASLGEDDGAHHRVIISRDDSAETLVIFDAAGMLGALKADIVPPDKLIADAIRKALDEGLIERALDTGTIQNASL